MKNYRIILKLHYRALKMSVETMAPTNISFFLAAKFNLACQYDTFRSGEKEGFGLDTIY